MSAEPDRDPRRPRRSRTQTVKPGRLAVTEATSDRAGAGSPFGDDITFPLPPEQLSYEHPSHGRPGPG
jgi:succinate dehydrogenase / fumarate reductase iron-sulfur subunit